jgi:hypothetical protein
MPAVFPFSALASPEFDVGMRATLWVVVSYIDISNFTAILGCGSGFAFAVPVC